MQKFNNLDVKRSFFPAHTVNNNHYVNFILFFSHIRDVDAIIDIDNLLICILIINIM